MKVKGIHAAPALLIVISALTAAAGRLDISKLGENTNPYLTVMIIELCCVGLPAVFFCLLRGGEYKGRLPLRTLRLSHIGISAYALLVIVCGSIALSILMYNLFPEAFAASAASVSSSAVANYGQTDSIYAALAFGILPALLEEFLFRGIVFAEYSPWGGAAAVIMSSLTFSMLHFNPVRLPIYLYCGIILALLTAATGSFIPAMVVHTANNIFVLYFEPYIYKVAGKHSGGLIMLAFLVITALLIAAALFFSASEKLYRTKSEKNAPSPLIRQRGAGEAPLLVQAFVSPTFIILVVFYLVASFLI